MEFDLSKYKFEENAELDAQLIYGNLKTREKYGDDLLEGAKAFSQFTRSLGFTDQLELLARGVWMLTNATPEYVAQVNARIAQLKAGNDLIN